MFKNDRELLEYVLAAMHVAEENAFTLPPSHRGSYLSGSLTQIEKVIEEYLMTSDDTRDINRGWPDELFIKEELK